VKRTATQPFKTIAQKYSLSDVSIILLTGEKYLLCRHQNAHPSTKKKDVATKCLH